MIFVIVIVAAGMTGMGVLGGERIMLEVQEILVLENKGEIIADGGTFICNCQNQFDPTEFGPQFCMFDTSDMFILSEP